MAEELQSLLEKIRTDGIGKAEAERDEILRKAREEAQELIRAAEVKAKEIRESAESDAESARVRAENSIRQSARDIVLKLKSELELRLKRSISSSVKSAMTPEFMAEQIGVMVRDFAKDPEAQITVLCSERDAEKLCALVKDTLGESFRNAPEIFGDNGVKSGMQISFRGDEVFFDFSAEAITGLIGQYTGEKLARILEER